MGHPEPFNLEYLGIGNEDLIDDVFRNRFQQIFDAVKAPTRILLWLARSVRLRAVPTTRLVGSMRVKPEFPSLTSIPISPPAGGSTISTTTTPRIVRAKVYLGEYGSWNTQLINGLSEAAFMGRMELNGDAVVMSSYAPLFAKNGHHSWNPDLIYFDNERTYLPYSYWVQQMYATTTSDTAWPVAVEGKTTLRRELPPTVGLRLEGAAHADITNFSVDTADGRHVDLEDCHYAGNGPMNTSLNIDSDAYTINATITYYQGRWGLQLVHGDINGKNHNITSFGRAFEIKVVRDGTAYNLDGTEWSMDEVFPGTVWQVRIEVADRGESMKLYIDGELVAQGVEKPEEPRRTVTVARNDAEGVTYVRIVNALDAEAEIDLNQVLEELGVSAESRASATATVLAGTDPYAGEIGKASPTVPVETAIDLTSGAYTAPSWSFTTLTLHD